MVASVALVTGYVIVLAFVAMRARAAREYAEFSLAKRSLPLALIFGSLCAAYVGPGFSIGFVGKGFQSGLLFLLIGLAYSAQNILVGVFIAPRLRSLTDCHTLGDAIGRKYNRTCQILAGVISVGLCMGFAAVMAKAGGVVVQDVFGIPKWIAIVLMAIVTMLYTSFGGLQASVMTDALQFTLFTLLMPAILLFTLFVPLNDGAAALAYELKAATVAGFRSTSWVQIAGLVAAFLLGETLIPPYANRALASKTTSASRNSFILAGLFSVVWFTVMIALGIVARAVVSPPVEEDRVLLALVRTIMPVGGYALLLVALISVILSSLDSLLNAGAVAFTEDVVRPIVAISDRASLACGRAATVGIAALAALAAVAVPSIINGLLICYTVWAPAILPAAVLGLWLKKPRPLAGILSMATGAAAALLLQLVWRDAVEIPAILVALAAALAAYLIGHLLGAVLVESR
ncbi:MAG: sodium:solute symporter family protein [Sedimentisphaerales bacterium]|nr:sodium:solute symporter family protein [Sedimentisphaerales bacterium]